MTTQNHEASPSGSEEQLDQAKIIEETGGVRPQNARHLIHCLSVIGQIEGHSNLPEDTKTTKYEHILPALVAIEQDRSIEGLLILLNTMGGDVEAGLAIAEMIAGMRTPTVSLVLGGGHSIGVPLACSARQSCIRCEPAVWCSASPRQHAILKKYRSASQAFSSGTATSPRAVCAR